MCLLLKAPGLVHDQEEALKKLAPRKALGSFDFNAAPPLPRDVCDNYNEQSAADHGPSTRGDTLSKSRLPVTSRSAEDGLAWVSLKASIAPLDLSLKILARFTSPDSFHWCVQNLHVFMHCLQFACYTCQDYRCDVFVY